MKVAFPILLCALLTGCNLVRGVGQDMAAVGRTLTKVSGTGDGHHTPEAAPESQPYNPTYNDQSYLEPDPVVTQ